MQSSPKSVAKGRLPLAKAEKLAQERKIRLPFVMGVLSDLSGKPTEAPPPVSDREFLDINVNNFDSRMKSMRPRAAFIVENALTGEGNLSVDVTFECMDDFSPAAVARKVDALNKLLEARQNLAYLLSYVDGNSGAQELLTRVLADPALLRNIAHSTSRDTR